MPIEQDQYGNISITGEESIALYAAIVTQKRLHLEASVPAFAPEMGKMVRRSMGWTTRNRWRLYDRYTEHFNLRPCSMQGCAKHEGV